MAGEGATGGPAASPGKAARVLIGKVGLDGHDRGAKVIARALRDAGMEVVYTGLHRTPEEVAAIARDEDVDLVGLSILSGTHLSAAPRVRAALDAVGLHGVPVILGGIIPDRDARRLREAGAVAAVFGPGSPTAEIVAWIRRWDGGRLASRPA